MTKAHLAVAKILILPPLYPSTIADSAAVCLEEASPAVASGSRQSSVALRARLSLTEKSSFCFQVDSF